MDAPPPEDPNLAGWFTGAVSPGEKGTSVIVGHVDNQQGPAVFYGLGSLKKGNHVEILREDDRKTAVFEIYGVEVFEKNNFPGSRVYSDRGQSGTPRDHLWRRILQAVRIRRERRGLRPPGGCALTTSTGGGRPTPGGPGRVSGEWRLGTVRRYPESMSCG